MQPLEQLLPDQRQRLFAGIGKFSAFAESVSVLWQALANRRDLCHNTLNDNEKRRIGMAAGIWVRLMKKNRIEKDITVDCVYEDWQEALGHACRQLDTGRPMVLPRHERDWQQFSQARFLKEHFVEDVPFDRMEVEFIDPEKKKNRQ